MTKLDKVKKIKYIREVFALLTALLLFLVAIRSCKVETKIIITGRVVSKLNEKPIKNAEVIIASTGGNDNKTFGPILTDSYGKFSIEVADGSVSHNMVVKDKDYKEYTLNSFSPKEVREVQLEPNFFKSPEFPTPPVPGEDSTGKKAMFKFHSLITNHAWRLGSSDELESLTSPYTTIKAQSLLEQKLSESNTQERIKQSKELIAVGVASCEGEKTQEENRAEERARVIQKTLTDASTVHKISLLLLGQYQKKDCDKSKNTIKQRQLIVIYVISKDEGILMKEALDNAREQLTEYLKNKSDSPLGVLRLKSYSLDELRAN
jgi:hypothetical protein